MKKIILAVAFLSAAAAVSAQSERYMAAMKSNIAAIDTSFRNPANLLSLANNFERIANAEKNQWLPYYYAALCQVNYAYMEQDKSKIDAIADKATLLIDKADSLSPDNSEISCVKSMIASSHMMVNPMQRYMEYGAEINLHLDAAMKQDPNNPRPEYLKGQGLKYTPEQFGGGCATAKPVLQASLDKYNAFKPASELHPNWGKQRVELLLGECK
ncbi:MAG TPA: hypothetical protein PLT49_11685 [Ferruginibacter sp.]|nr:hypothetical protein [Ferruginibacter sp.]HMX78939.1 hypothetical protein [Ferruginibacter sp.]HNA15635.1 hypothetical protein [Ferruginibacter sp.]HNF02541.1 hypothetical protein [Ferruginibacter sp.]HNF44329.1 hypothetical protein [Ferruginibacter sp.]